MDSILVKVQETFGSEEDDDTANNQNLSLRNM